MNEISNNTGLNYGYSYHFKKPKPIGVIFIDKINCWVVRILKKGVPTTLVKFNSKEEAEKYYKNIELKTK